MKHKSKNGIIMKSSIKILAACSFMMLGVTSCDLTGINENPDKPTDDVNYNMNEPRLASTLRGGMIIDGDVEQRLKPLQIDFYSQMLIDGGGWATKNYIQNDEWNNLTWQAYLTQISSINIVIRSLMEKIRTYMLIRSLSLVSGVCISIARLRISLVRCLSRPMLP